LLLKIDNLKKTFSAKGKHVPAVDDVSLDVDKGELVAVNGPSGCGKTTLLLIAGGLLVPDEGKVWLDGTDFYSISSEQRTHKRASSIGFVFQQFHLLPYLNILQNVMVPGLGTGNSSESRARELIDLFNLTSRIDHKPSQLSTGERQRVALVRALINKPQILFADEPTGNLDDDNAEEVIKYISLFAEEGGGVLLVSHDTRTAFHANRTYRMKQGKFIQE